MQKGMANPLQKETAYNRAELSRVACPYCSHGSHQPKMQFFDKATVDAENKLLQEKYQREREQFNSLREAERKKRKRPKLQTKPYILVCLCFRQNCCKWLNGRGCYECEAGHSTGQRPVIDNGKCQCSTCKCDCQGFLDSVASLHKVTHYVLNNADGVATDTLSQSGKVSTGHGCLTPVSVSSMYSTEIVGNTLNIVQDLVQTNFLRQHQWNPALESVEQLTECICANCGGCFTIIANANRRSGQRGFSRYSEANTSGELICCRTFVRH